jgi:hypothetical protein
VAKQQSFADKAKGKVKSEEQSIKCVFAVYDEVTKSWKFRQQMRRVKSAADIENLKF